MKLVDILARELKDWPEGYGDIGQAESGKLHVVTGWNYQIGWTSESYTQAEDWTSAVITRAEWQAAVEALKAEQVAYSYENSDVNASFASLTEYPANAECKIIAPKEAEQAAELKWPDGAEFMGTTKEGDPKVFYRNVGGGFYEFAYTDGSWTAQTGYPAKAPLIPRPTERAVEWDGVGLPPVDSYLEVHDQEGWRGKRAKVIHNFESQIGDEMVVVESDEDASCACFNIFSLRPIRTPEQIAAEEREKAIEEMILLDEKGSLSRTHFCGLLYDAGYGRKQVAE